MMSSEFLILRGVKVSTQSIIQACVATWNHAEHGNKSLITNYELRIMNYELPITNYQLPISNYKRKRGSSASRKPSPSRLKPRTVIIIAIPGNRTK